MLTISILMIFSHLNSGRRILICWVMIIMMMKIMMVDTMTMMLERRKSLPLSIGFTPQPFARNPLFGFLGFWVGGAIVAILFILIGLHSILQSSNNTHLDRLAHSSGKQAIEIMLQQVFWKSLQWKYYLLLQANVITMPQMCLIHNAWKVFVWELYQMLES